MQLVHRKVPREFLDVLPEGVKFITRHGQEFLVVEEICCPNGHSLMSDRVRIHNEPSICIAIDRPEGRGLVFIDAYWGSHAKLFNFMADPDHPMEYADARCPHCGVSLVVERNCAQMGCSSTKSLHLQLPGDRNSVYVCAKMGCPGHTIVVGSVPTHITEEINTINFFGYGEDDDAFGGI